MGFKKYIHLMKVYNYFLILEVKTIFFKSGTYEVLDQLPRKIQLETVRTTSVYCSFYK